MKNFVKKSYKYALVRVKTYDLSNRIIFVHSQSRDTIPLSSPSWRVDSRAVASCIDTVVYASHLLEQAWRRCRHRMYSFIKHFERNEMCGDQLFVFNLCGEYVCQDPDYVSKVATILPYVHLLFGNRNWRPLGTFCPQYKKKRGR